MTPVPRTTFILLVSLAAGCATEKQSWQRPPEVLVDVMPKSALLAVDGVSLGAGGRIIPVPNAAHVYVLTAIAQGFTPIERTGTGTALAGGQITLVLRPEGYGEARRLDLTDSAGLAAAAVLLERRAQHREAMEYAERSLEVGPEQPLAHRVIGDAAYALKQHKRAIDAYSAYLAASPGAPDRRVVEGRVEKLRGDITIPAPVDR
jgi:hypothetical protein